MDKDPNELVTLSDEELREIAAGSSDSILTWIKDTRGREVGMWFHGELYYYPCPKCGRPTHSSWSRRWCDKCDDDWTGLYMSRWYGTEDELKAAGAAN